MGTGFYILFYHFLGCWNPPNPQQHKKQIQHERFSESRWWFQTLVNFFPSICGFRFNLNIFQNGLVQTPSVVTILGSFFFSNSLFIATGVRDHYVFKQILETLHGHGSSTFYMPKIFF